MRAARTLRLLWLSAAVAALSRTACATATTGTNRLSEVIDNESVAKLIAHFGAAYLEAPQSTVAHGRGLAEVKVDAKAFLSALHGLHTNPKSKTSGQGVWGKKFDIVETIQNFPHLLPTGVREGLRGLNASAVAEAVQALNSEFCTPAVQTNLTKADPSWVGPIATISYVPETCVFDSAKDKIVCEPASLVVTTTPAVLTLKDEIPGKFIPEICSVTKNIGKSETIIIGGATHDLESHPTPPAPAPGPSPSHESPYPSPPSPPSPSSPEDTHFYSYAAGIFKGTRRFVVHGFNWFGFETSFQAPGLLWGATVGLTDYLDFLAAQEFTAMRVLLPASTAIALDTTYPPNSAETGSINYDRNPQLRGLSSGGILDVMISEAGARGIYTVLNIHREVPDGPITELWNEDLLTEANVALATRYVDSPYLMGLDLKNEPHGSATWGTGDPVTDWCAASGRIGTAVNAVNPNVLVFVEGVQYYDGEAAPWGAQLAGVRSCQPDIGNQRKLVYTPHVYAESITGINSSPDDWDAWFGFIKTTTDQAVVVGEWGGASPGNGPSNDAQFQSDFAEYLLSTRIRDHFYWTLNWNADVTGGLTLDDDNNWDQWKLDLLTTLRPGQGPVDLVPILADS